MDHTQLVNTLYQLINKAHNEVKNREVQKVFYTLRDCVVINNAYRSLLDPKADVIEECKDKQKCVKIFEEALLVAYNKGSFTIDESLLLNKLLVSLKSTLETKVASNSNEKSETVKTESLEL
jgi:hypothetical protein